MLSVSLYFFCWFYITWKQLATEIGGDHHPVWHALSLFVPIYNLFRIHKHMSVIKNLSIATSFSPGAIVVLTMASGALDWNSITVDDTAIVLVMGFVSTALTTFVVA